MIFLFTVPLQRQQLKDLIQQLSLWLAAVQLIETGAHLFLPGTNGSGKLLAAALANQGFVTLRYDKIASGPHVKDNIPKLVGKISKQSHLEELKGAVETLMAQENVEKDNVFVLTNSEGAIHAVNYQLQAKNNRFKGLVLTDPPGRAIGELARCQIFEQIKNMPNAQTIVKAYDDAITAFSATHP